MTDQNDNNDAPTIESLTADLDKWKAHARTWEDRAKENSKAAKELADLKKASMSEDEKRSAEIQEIRDALAKAVDRAALVEATNQRLSIVTEFGLSPDDAKVLEDISSTDAMRAVAERLSNAAPASTGPKPNPAQGVGSGEPVSAKDATIDALGALFNG